MGWLLRDVRFGFRTILKDRAFFLAAILALALGIGSTTAIFSVIDNVMLRPFPYTDGQRIFGLTIHDQTSTEIYPRNWFYLPEFLDYQRQNQVFTDTMGVWEKTVILGGAGNVESLDADTVTGNTFQFLGVPALLGRGIQPSDAQVGASGVFVLSYKVWAKRFGSDASIVGKTFILDDRPTTLVGVMPQRFAFWGGDVWLPASLDPAEPGSSKRRLVMYGHLKPGLDAKTAAAQLQILATRFAKIYREDYPKQFNVTTESLVDIAIGRIKDTLFTLLAAVGLLLLIACANVANLLLAKATGRQKELTLRFTLGATRFQVVRQMIVESVMLAVAGAALGCAFASAGLKGLLAILPIFTFPDEADIDLNLPVLLGTLSIAIVTTFIFGLAPALAASRSDLNDPLKSGGRGNSGFRRGRLRNVLIVSEVALSLLLLTGAGLLMRSFFLQREVNLGIKTDHLLVTSLNLSPTHYKDTETQARFLRELLPRLQNLPGVVSASGSLENPPLGGVSTDFEVAGITHAERWAGFLTPCSWNFFQTMRAPLLAGRLLTPADENGKRMVVVINESMAHSFFGRQNPLGRQVQLSALKTAAGAWFEVIGVVADIKNKGSRLAAAPEAYLPYTVAGFGYYNIFVRTLGDPAAFSRALESQILALDRGVIPQGTLPVERVMEIREYARPRFALILFGVFAGIGLLLVSVGVYSVISYTVTQQQHEIGIRLALGASVRDVRGLVLKAGLRFIVMGVLAGLVLTLVAGRMLASQVWGVAWYDPMTLGGVILVLTIIGLGAAYLPSVRATRVDPVVSLRYE